MHHHTVVFAPRQMVRYNLAESLGEQALVNAFNGSMHLFLARGDPARGISRVAHDLFAGLVIEADDLEDRPTVALVRHLAVLRGHAVDFRIADEQGVLAVTHRNHAR